MAIGRPLTYKPEYCDEVIDLGKQGKSLTQMAAHFGVTRETIYAWRDRFPAFSDALTQARIYSQAWWEDVGQAGLYADKFNATLWVKQMASRFPDDYTDKSRQEVTGAGGGAVKVDSTIKVEFVRPGDASGPAS